MSTFSSPKSPSWIPLLGTLTIRRRREKLNEKSRPVYNLKLQFHLLQNKICVINTILSKLETMGLIKKAHLRRNNNIQIRITVVALWINLRSLCQHTLWCLKRTHMRTLIVWAKIRNASLTCLKNLSRHTWPLQVTNIAMLPKFNLASTQMQLEALRRSNLWERDWIAMKLLNKEPEMVKLVLTKMWSHSANSSLNMSMVLLDLEIWRHLCKILQKSISSHLRWIILQ